MQTKFTPSTNIIRDFKRDLNYITTPNAIAVANQIFNDYNRGIRSLNIIGSFGTGKSSFFWALQQSLKGDKQYFNIKGSQYSKVDILNLIGEYKSIIEVLSGYFNIGQRRPDNAAIFSEIYNRYHDLRSENPLLVIFIDEFGKFLEYAANNEPERELYFIQELAEFVNNSDYNILLLTATHQNFDAYAIALSTVQRLEWTKVKGRFREITFNEPVEQLLYLASEHLIQKRLDKQKMEIIKQVLSVARDSQAFKINQDFANEIGLKLFPIDFFAANVLAITLQKYGQNERSLFSFLESTDLTGIESFRKTNDLFYNISNVYDYLLFNFYSYLNSRYNPDFASWSAIKISLEIAERSFDEEVTPYFKLLKTIGLISITASNGSDLGIKFLSDYASICLGIKDTARLIDNLEKKKIIQYRNYNKRYVLSEGTDLDITSALIEAESKVTNIIDLVTLLKREYQLPPIYAKSYSYLTGTPRLFEFIISSYPINEVPYNEIDGFINLIFNDQIDVQEIKERSKLQEEAIIYGYYQNSKTIRNQLFEIEKTRKVIDENTDDRVAIKELNNILVHQQNLLNHYILSNLYSEVSEIKWIFKGEEKIVKSKKDFNKLLSQICFEVYSKTPVFKNELVNKHKISSAVQTAKNNFIVALTNRWNKPDLGFESYKFPPEKTIYLTLLKENGIDLYSDTIDCKVEVDANSSFIDLWNFSEGFLYSARLKRKPISDFIEPLNRKPFKLKQGLIDFWIAIFLFIKREDYALFDENGYIPYLTNEVLGLVIKYPEKYEIKAFDIDGIRLNLFNSYRLLINQNEQARIGNQSFIETIKPFLTFYRNLPEYTKTTKRLKKETISIREAISNAKDPEKVFFEDLPNALNYNIELLQNSHYNLQYYINSLQESVRELRLAFDNLIIRFEDFILSEFIGEQLPFDEYKQKFQFRYKGLKRHLCLPYQKAFVQRIDSQLDDRKAWLSSLAQSVIGKALDSIKDEEELILYDKFKSLILELDSLSNISRTEIDEENEDILGVELSSFVDGIQKKMVRLPKTKRKEVSYIETLIKENLSGDKTLNIAAVINVLKNLLKK